MAEPTDDEKARALVKIAIGEAECGLIRGKQIVCIAEIVLLVLFVIAGDAAAGGEWFRMGYNLCLCAWNAINCWEMHCSNAQFEKVIKDMRTQFHAAIGESSI